MEMRDANIILHNWAGLRAISHTRWNACDHCIEKSLIGRKSLRPSKFTSQLKVDVYRPKDIIMDEKSTESHT